MRAMRGWAAPESRTTPLTIHTSQLYTPAVEEEHTWCVPRQSNALLRSTAHSNVQGVRSYHTKTQLPLPLPLATGHCRCHRRKGQAGTPDLSYCDTPVVSQCSRTSHCFALDPATAVVRGRQRCVPGREVMHRQGGGSLTLYTAASAGFDV